MPGVEGKRGKLAQFIIPYMYIQSKGLYTVKAFTFQFHNTKLTIKIVAKIIIYGKYLLSISPAIHRLFIASQHLGTTQDPQNISTTKSFSLLLTSII